MPYEVSHMLLSATDTSWQHMMVEPLNSYSYPSIYQSICQLGAEALFRFMGNRYHVFC